MPFKSRLGSRCGRIICCLGIALGALCLTADAQVQPSTQPSTQTLADSGQSSATLSVTTREVLLDVVVTDKAGQPLTGLTVADFVVNEEGDLQHLSHLEEHRSMSAEDLAKLKAAQKLPPNTFTDFVPVASTNASTVILLDALDTHVQAQMELREQLIDCLKHIQPGTPVSIFQIDTEMRLIQGFTTDPQVLYEAAKSKRDLPTLQKLIRGSPDEYRRAKQAILHSGFQLMGRYLAGFPGRKNLIWLTGGVPQSYMTDPLSSDVGKAFSDDFVVLGDNPDDLVDALTLSRVAVYPIDARGLQTPPQFQASNNSRPSFTGAGAGPGFEGRQAFQHMDLDRIAEATGGKAYYNTNGLKQVIAGIIDNGSSYYTLAYATTNKKWNGQFRNIRVTINRPGVHVQYRHGYYAVDRDQQAQQQLADMRKKKARSGSNPFGEEAASSGALIKHPDGGFAATMELGAIPPTEIIFTASLAIDDKVVKLDKNAPLPPDNYLIAEYKGKPFRTYNLQIQADARSLVMTRSADGVHHGTVEFVTLVYDQTGNRVNSLITTAVLNISDAHYRRMMQSGLPVKQQIAIPVKGNYFLRVGVHDVASDHIGAIEIPVDEVHTGVVGQGLLGQ